MAEHGQTTGNVPVESIDPGGTHAAPKSDVTRKGPSQLPGARPEVESGDRNTASETRARDTDEVKARP